jgi:ABC-type multidrug transport system fused ATPase/permease subunit
MEGRTTKKLWERRTPDVREWRVPPREAWREYIHLYRGQYLLVLLAVVLSAAPPAVAGLIALVLKKDLDRALRPEGNILRLVLTVVGLYLFSNALQLAARYLTLRTTKLAVRTLRLRLFDRLLRLSRSVTDRTDSVTIHTSIVDDSERIDMMSNAIVTSFLPAAAAVIVIGGVLLYTSLRLALILALSFPVAILISRFVRQRARASTREFRQKYADYSGSVLSSTRSLDLIRVEAAEKEVMADHTEAVDDLRFSSVRMAWLMASYPLVQQSIITVLSGVVLLVGGWAIHEGKMTMGEMLAFFAGVMLLRSQLGPLVFVAGQTIAGEYALERTFGFLKVAEAEPYRGTAPLDFDGRLKVDHVSFSYGETPVLKNVSFATEPGSIIAITGKNGCGKTTLLHLLVGFYAPTSGALHASGKRFDEIDITSYRSQIGFLGQEPTILNGTVRQNITFGAQDATEEEIREALTLACAEELVDSLPEGMETYVGEEGVLLSGGQRQRIALARALLRRPRLMIFDEPTNHLDRATVTGLLRNLRRTPWPHATLVVSHDLEVVAEADEILLMKGGELEQRSRSEVLAGGAFG